MTTYRVKVLMLAYQDESDLGAAEPLTCHVRTAKYVDGDHVVTVEYHRYLIYSVYARCGFRYMPTTGLERGLYGVYATDGQPVVPPYHPAQVDNLTMPPALVLERQAEELSDLAKSGDFDVAIWYHFRHCYPQVAQNLKRWFRHSVSVFGDDCPQSAITKTNPVAKYFDSAIHCNLIFDRTTGQTTKDYYLSHGVMDNHYVTLGPSMGFANGLTNMGFSRQDKIDRLKQGATAPTDLVFVGPLGGKARTDLANSVAMFRRAGLLVKFHGLGMPDGPVNPRSGYGYPIAPIYANAFAGVIPAIWGLAGTRLWDYLQAGVLNFMHDPGKELEMLGFLPGVHYVDYDDTPNGLLAAVLEMKARPQVAAVILEAGIAKGQEIQKQFTMEGALAKIFLSHRSKWSVQ